jgi:hypothetical protein
MRLFNYSVDDFGHRLSSFPTYTPAAYLPYLEGYGKKYELDLRCSQPTFLVQWLSNKGLQDDRFRTLVERDSIYKAIMHSKNCNRAASKTILYGLLYDKPYGGSFKALKSMDFLEPESLEAIKLCKVDVRNPREWGRKKYIKPHSNLSMDLQRMESQVFASIWKQLMAEKVPFVSRHDSVVILDETKLQQAQQICFQVLRDGLPDVKAHLNTKEIR